MGDALYELLQPYLSSSSASSSTNPLPIPSPNDPTTSKYLSRLSTLPFASLTSTEPQSLAQSTHTNLLSIQSLSARSNAALVASSSHLSSLRTALPALSSQASTLRETIPNLDTASLSFSEKYSRRRNAEENSVLDRRKTSLLLTRNADRLSDIFELPTLLTSAIASASSSSSSTASGAAAAGGVVVVGQNTNNNNNSYASALDLYGHIKRLHLLYPTSGLVTSIHAQSERAMQDMAASLIDSLRVGQTIKLAAAMRTVGWLRRVCPDLDPPPPAPPSSSNSAGGLAATTTTAASLGSGGGFPVRRGEGHLGALFLVCRLATLLSTLSALEPLRDLADQETAEMRVRDFAAQTTTTTTTAGGQQGRATTTRRNKDQWSQGQQTERYLKRYIEIFREQSFAIVGMYRSIFPPPPPPPPPPAAADGGEKEGVRSKSSGLVAGDDEGKGEGGGSVGRRGEDLLLGQAASALATFPIHLVGMLEEMLREYLPNVRDKASRESLLTQVLYCAGSLGRLGGDFSLMLADLSVVGGHGDGEDDDEDEDEDDAEWVAVMKKHRVLAGKLEKMASGVATT